MPEKALIVIDMLNDFVDEKGALYCGPESRAIIPFIAGRLAEYRKNSDPVIYLQDSHDKNDLEFQLFPEHGVAGTWGNAIIDELAPEPGDIVIPKTRFSGFYGTDLEQAIKNSGVEKVEVTGVCTSICVMDTVGGLVNRNYKVTIFSAGVADFDPDFHEFALRRMQRTYGAEII